MIVSADFSQKYPHYLDEPEIISPQPVEITPADPNPTQWG